MGTHPKSTGRAAFRAALACVLILELVALRWPALGPFYSDAGTLPLSVVLRARAPRLARAACPHLWRGSLGFARALWGAQLGASLAMAAGARGGSALCLWLYASATLRNARVTPSKAA